MKHPCKNSNYTQHQKHQKCSLCRRLNFIHRKCLPRWSQDPPSSLTRGAKPWICCKSEQLEIHQNARMMLNEHLLPTSEEKERKRVPPPPTMRLTTIRLFHHCQYRQQHKQGIHQKGCWNWSPLQKHDGRKALLFLQWWRRSTACRRTPATTYAEVLHATIGVEAKVKSTHVASPPWVKWTLTYLIQT